MVSDKGGRSVSGRRARMPLAAQRTWSPWRTLNRLLDFFRCQSCGCIWTRAKAPTVQALISVAPPAPLPVTSRSAILRGGWLRRPALRRLRFSRYCTVDRGSDRSSHVSSLWRECPGGTRATRRTRRPRPHRNQEPSSRRCPDGLAPVDSVTHKRRPMAATITCPLCGHRADEEIPATACLYFYVCQGCGVLLKPKLGNCCVFCSYATRGCPFCA
jgi:hypothetical protein